MNLRDTITTYATQGFDFVTFAEDTTIAEVHSKDVRKHNYTITFEHMPNMNTYADTYIGMLDAVKSGIMMTYQDQPEQLEADIRGYINEQAERQYKQAYKEYRDEQKS